MAKAKIAITIDEATLADVDRLVAARRYDNRSQAIEDAVREKTQRLKGLRLATECLKLDRYAERALANEGLEADSDSWPAY